MTKKKHIVVIGAGFSGLSAAAYLARDGYRVTVLEKNAQPGGRAHTLEQDGFRFELGPSWYMMPDIFEEFFADFGTEQKDHYTLTRLDPNYRVFFAGNQQFDIADSLHNKTLFSQLEPGAGVELERFIAKSEKYHTFVREHFLTEDSSTIWQMLHPKSLLTFVQMPVFKNYHQVIKQHFHDPRLQQMLGFMCVFLGASPRSIPGIYTLLAHVDMNQGIWYPEGGFTNLAEVFARFAKSQGVTIKYNHAVTSIEVRDGTARAVRVGKKRIVCDAVIGAADYHFIETKLLKPASQTYPQRYWNKKDLSPSALLISVGLNTKLSNLAHHNLFFDTDWNEDFKQLYKKKEWPEEPQFYVSIPSKTDATVAPEGHEAMFVLVPLAAGLEHDELAQRELIKNVYARIGERAQLDIAKHTVSEDIRSIDYFKDTFNSYQGNAFGLSHTLFQGSFLRPKNRSKKVSNLFYTGQYTNPGTGVPLAVLSGKIVAKAFSRTPDHS